MGGKGEEKNKQTLLENCIQLFTLLHKSQTLRLL